MKRSPLKRKVPLKKKTSLKAKIPIRAKKKEWKTKTITTKSGKKRKITNPYWKQVKKTDTLFSIMRRLQCADENGFVTCFTSGKKGFWKRDGMELGHYLS